MAGLRSGTHSTKVRSDVAGSGRKLWKQKGTGRARVGSIRSPLWRHGGTVHGPHPRDYSYSLNKKMIKGALRSALSSKVADQKLVVVDTFNLESPKTKEFIKVLKGFEAGRQVLVVDAAENRNLVLGSRNLDGVAFRAARRVNTYDLLNCDRVLISQQAVKGLEEALAL